MGLLTADPNTVLEEGAQIVPSAVAPKGTHAIGHVTSAYRSPAVGRSIALAVVEGGRSRIGERLFVPGPGGPITVEVVAPVFYDPKGERLDG